MQDILKPQLEWVLTLDLQVTLNSTTLL